MSFDVHIQNLGKLANATVKVAPLTVLAGPNNTGKSYFSKALYSVLHALGENHAEVEIQRLVAPLHEGLRVMKYHARADRKSIDPLESSIEKLIETYSSLAEENQLSVTREFLPKISDIVDDVIRSYKDMFPVMEAVFEKRPRYRFGSRRDKDDMASIEACVKELYSLKKIGIESVVLSGLRSAIESNLIGNFQIPVLRGLRGNPKEKISLNIDEVIDFGVDETNVSNLKIHHAELVELKQYSRVIYLETPAHWKLKRALESALRSRFFNHRSRQRLDVPKYFQDLSEGLGESYSGEAAFPELLERLKEIIGGQIAISERGELVFQEFGRNEPFILPMTATGIVNLGMLALLIETKILDKDVFLFIDEPESHLHPVWQVEMMRTLFDLAQQGVNVVIATHSSDILECINALIKKKSDLQELVALNHFAPDGKGGAHVVNSDKDFIGQLDAIQSELTDPFYQSYMEAL